MMNLNDMTSKQLKELGKQHGVKNWWNLNKAALIAALTVESEVTNDFEPDTCQLEIIDSEPEKTEVIEPDTAVESESAIESKPDECQPEVNENESKKTKKPNLKIHELTFDGKTQSIRAWAEELEMPWPTLYDRVNRNGWTTEEALTIPLGGRRKAN